MTCSSAKAHQLTALATQLKVPVFQVVQSSASINYNILDDSSQFIVRGCLLEEDQLTSSLAGQGKSYGPVEASAISATVDRIFSETNSVECIIQQFIEGESGVLFCLSPKIALLEYSKRSRGVTSGSVNPFVAVFPNDFKRYQNISDSLESIFAEHGPCNLELVNITDPYYVQVRPTVADLNFDEEFYRLKMLLQELTDDVWIQDEFCLDLAESPGFERSLIQLFCKLRNHLFEECNLEIEDIEESDFLKIGKQIFVPSRLASEPRGKWSSFVKLGKWLWCNFQELAPKFKNRELDAEELMKLAFVLRLVYGLFEKWPNTFVGKWRRDCFAMRISCRDYLLGALEENSLPTKFEFSNRLEARIEKYSDRLEWGDIRVSDTDGIVVIHGDFNSGPWVRYEGKNTALESRAFLVADELYPAIYNFFPDIKGIICEGGSITSHLAILAREHKMPLWIQVKDAGRQFPKK